MEIGIVDETTMRDRPAVRNVKPVDYRSQHLHHRRLRVFPSLEAHNLRRLLARGLCVTINSDDPAYFGGYINENFLATHHALGLTRDEIHRLARNSFEASFLSAGERRSFIDELDVAVRAGASPSPDVGGG